ncbi:hypothetical protein A0256_08565 [Mucilaginibacter sp. PAMC 26640]|nr:hypothetical protein A0256_08565 [Mucilaginibacter sp. PAMC 26640]
MRNLILLLTFSIILFDAKAQNPEMAKAIVHYKFSHLQDTTAKDKPYTENMVLFLGQTASAYKSYDKRLQDAMMKKQVEQQIADQKGNGGPISIKVTGTKPTTSAEIYQYPVLNKIIRKESLITSYLIEEPMPTINWKISNDTASFGTLHCQKATAHFKGRDYTAWFCPDLPFHAGPWKLNGLPGLIVEAYDAKKEVEFKFDGFDQVVATDKPAAVSAGVAPPSATVVKFGGMDEDASNPNLISVPVDAVKTTEKEFVKLQTAMRKDPQAFMAAMGGGMQDRVSPAGSGGPSNTIVRIGPGNGPVINNPIELPEKK